MGIWSGGFNSPLVGEGLETGSNKKAWWTGQHGGTHALDSGIAEGITKNPPSVLADPVTRKSVLVILASQTTTAPTAVYYRAGVAAPHGEAGESTGRG